MKAIIASLVVLVCPGDRVTLEITPREAETIVKALEFYAENGHLSCEKNLPDIIITTRLLKKLKQLETPNGKE